MSPRRSYRGNAAPTTLSGGISSGVTAAAVVDGSSYPDGSAGPYFITVDKGLVGEEKILVNTRTGNSFTSMVRGQDSTTAVAHSIGATVNHCFTAVDADEANQHRFGTPATAGDTDTASGIHHTLGAGAAQAAAGNHTHAGGNFATLTGTETLTNKTITGGTLNGSTSSLGPVFIDADIILGGSISTSTNMPRFNNGGSNVPVSPNVLMQSGIITATFAGGSSITGTLTFPTAYAASGSLVLVSVNSNATSRFVAANTTDAATATTFPWVVFTRDGAAFTGTVYLNWLAIGL